MSLFTRRYRWASGVSCCPVQHVTGRLFAATSIQDVGDEVWRVDHGSDPIGAGMDSSDNLYVACKTADLSGNHIFAHDSSGSLLWSADNGGDQPEGMVLGLDGYLYTWHADGPWDGYPSSLSAMKKLDPSSGVVVADFHLDPGVTNPLMFQPAIDASGKIYASGTVYTNSGTLLSGNRTSHSHTLAAPSGEVYYWGATGCGKLAGPTPAWTGKEPLGGATDFSFNQAGFSVTAYNSTSYLSALTNHTLFEGGGTGAVDSVTGDLFVGGFRNATPYTDMAQYLFANGQYATPFNRTPQGYPIGAVALNPSTGGYAIAYNFDNDMDNHWPFSGTIYVFDATSSFATRWYWPCKNTVIWMKFNSLNELVVVHRRGAN